MGLTGKPPSLSIPSPWTPEPLQQNLTSVLPFHTKAPDASLRSGAHGLAVMVAQGQHLVLEAFPLYSSCLGGLRCCCHSPHLVSSLVPLAASLPPCRSLPSASLPVSFIFPGTAWGDLSPESHLQPHTCAWASRSNPSLTQDTPIRVSPVSEHHMAGAQPTVPSCLSPSHLPLDTQTRAWPTSQIPFSLCSADNQLLSLS